LVLYTFRLVLANRQELAQSSPLSVLLFHIDSVKAVSSSENGGETIRLPRAGDTSASFHLESGAAELASRLREQLDTLRPRLLSVKYGDGVQWLNMLEPLQRHLDDARAVKALDASLIHSLADLAAEKTGARKPNSHHAELQIEYKRGQSDINAVFDLHKHKLVL
jgi:hypothetical protein